MRRASSAPAVVPGPDARGVIGHEPRPNGSRAATAALAGELLAAFLSSSARLNDPGYS
jgi:hypothetical protein